MDYTPGQYVQLSSPAHGECNEQVDRAYSISSDPSDKRAIELIIRRVPGGICTTWCFEYLAVGDSVKFNGPYGEFRLSDTQSPIIFVAGGSGIAPVKSMLHQMKNENIKRSSVFFFGSNTVEEQCLGDLMHQFEQDLEDFRFVPVVAQHETNSNWTGEVGLVTEALERQVEDASNTEAYLCGAPGMIDATITVLKKLGMPEEKIYYDKFA